VISLEKILGSRSIACKLNVSFLPLPVNKWQSNEAHIASLANVRAANVVNDGAERGVKLASDFVDTARDDKHFQNVLQVVEEDRKAVPDLRRRKGCSSTLTH
jgi:hypothetical protein